MLVYGGPMKAALFLVVSLLTLNSFAGLAEDYNTLKNNGKDYSTIGVICEEVTQLRYMEQYPEPAYRVLTGIAYSDKTRTIGELDLIVFDNQTHDVKLIGEVKCWKDAKGGLKKARDQRQRFFSYIHSNKDLTFKWLSHPEEKFVKSQFTENKEFVSISQLGTKAAGFDVELDYTLDELMQMRADIMACQDSGECAKAQH
jgi:hypothetical protein